MILDDNRFDRHRLRRLLDTLEMDIELEEADTLASFSEKLDGQRYDLIFIDYRLSDGDGLQALDLARKHAQNAAAATIMIAGEAQVEIAVTALQNGCSDYIIKDKLGTESLQRAMINAMQKSRLAQNLASEESLRMALRGVLDGFAQDCVTDMKPMLSRMLRQIRGMRANAEERDRDAVVGSVDTLEASCLKLWKFLEDIEAYEAEPRLLS